MSKSHTPGDNPTVPDDAQGRYQTLDVEGTDELIIYDSEGDITAAWVQSDRYGEVEQ